MKVKKTKTLCTCGHDIKNHRLDLKECYTFKHKKGSHYQCTCKQFEEMKE